MVIKDGSPIVAQETLKSFQEFSKEELELELQLQLKRFPYPYLAQVREREYIRR